MTLRAAMEEVTARLVLHPRPSPAWTLREAAICMRGAVCACDLPAQTDLHPNVFTLWQEHIAKLFTSHPAIRYAAYARGGVQSQATRQQRDPLAVARLHSSLAPSSFCHQRVCERRWPWLFTPVLPHIPEGRQGGSGAHGRWLPERRWTPDGKTDQPSTPGVETHGQGLVGSLWRRISNSYVQSVSQCGY